MHLLEASQILPWSNGNISRVTGRLCGEFTGDRWIPRTNGQWHGALMFSLIWCRDGPVLSCWLIMPCYHIGTRPSATSTQNWQRLECHTAVQNYLNITIWQIMFHRCTEVDNTLRDHFDIFVNDCTRSCYFGKFHCILWWTFIRMKTFTFLCSNNETKFVNRVTMESNFVDHGFVNFDFAASALVRFFALPCLAVIICLQHSQ